MASVAEILSSCGKRGDRIYSVPWGYVKLASVDMGSDDCYHIKLDCGNDNVCWLDGDGRLTSDGECLIWPSYTQRDWEAWGKEHTESPSLEVGDYVEYGGMQWFVEFVECTGRIELTSVVGNKGVVLYQTSRDKITKAEKFDHSQLQTYDRVLVRSSKVDGNNYLNRWYAAFFSHYEDGRYFTDGFGYKYCVPYNDTTKHLVGTTDDAPDFYKL